jgi:hypothetical protein
MQHPAKSNDLQDITIRQERCIPAQTDTHKDKMAV